jgi:tRNA dimethylallyltransferase
MNEQPELIVILGPTATGKTRVAALLAKELGSCVISADSRQVYKYMDIGTGKDIQDYTVDGFQVPYYMTDVAEPGTHYNLFEYQRDFHKVYNEVKHHPQIPVLCGGSGLYVDCIVRNYDLREVPQNPELRKELKKKPLEELKQILTGYIKLHNETDVDTVNRAVRAIEIAVYQQGHRHLTPPYPEIQSLVYGIDCDREERRTRISKRLRKRVDEGLIDEVNSLLNRGVTHDDLVFYGLEYKYVSEYLRGILDKENFLTQLETAIHQFAKRQMTFFRSMERKGVKIHWLSRKLSDNELVTAMLSAIKAHR